MRHKPPISIASSSLRPLPRAELPSPTIALARFLVGKVLVREDGGELLSGRIVETEAYPPGDEAGHARSGRTARNASLFLDLGHIYVYRAYGTAMMLNMSAEGDGVGAGVLIRAAEPLTGIDVMRVRRGVDDIRGLARGPGRLAQAFDIGFGLDGKVFDPGSGLWLADDGAKAPRIGRSVRIGITRNPDKLWRFFVSGSRFVSGPAKLNGG